MKKYHLTLFISIIAIAQGAAQSMIDSLLRSDGKIYVVVGTLAIILIGIFLFLIRIDSNLTKLENQIKQNEH